MNTKRLSGFPLLAVLALFAMPFVTVSCEGLEIARVTGYDMVFGGEVSADEGLFGSEAAGESEPVDVEPMAIAAIVAAVVGLVLAFTGQSKMLVAGVSAIGLVALLVLFGQNQSELSQLADESDGLMSASFGVGFWGAVAAFALAGFLAWREDGASAGGGAAPPSAPPPA